MEESKTKKPRWSNEPRPLSLKALKRVHWLKKNGWSYRDLGNMLRRDHCTVRRYYLRWINRPWYVKLLEWIK